MRQRADRYAAIGRPKSAAGERVIPMPPRLVSALREWKLACPNGELGLAFPDAKGGDAAAAAGNMERAGLAAKYGWHSLRHFYASWCINRKVDGGLELPLKVVQARLGHSSISVTADVYGHLFPRGDDGAELEVAETALLG